MGLNVSEIVLVIVVIVLIIGMGQLPSIAESIGRLRAGKRALDGPDAAPGEVNVSPPGGARGPIARAPDEAAIRGPEEDAELLPKD